MTLRKFYWTMFCALLFPFLLQAQTESLLWRSISLGHEIVTNGVSIIEWADGTWQSWQAGGRACIRMKPNNAAPSAYLYFSVDDNYIYNDAYDVFVTIEYWDTGTGSFSLQYDDGHHAYNVAGSQSMTNSDTWKKRSFVLPVVGFTNQQNGGADFRLVVADTSLGLLAVKHVFVWRAPGDFIAPKQTDYTGESFASDDNLVFTYYFYWYDICSGAHIWDNPQHTDDALQDHPFSMEDFSFKSVAWHKQELLDMMDAGIDVVLPVYWGAARMMKNWSIEGLGNLVKAEQELIAEGKKPPRIGMFFDTSTLTSGEYILREADGPADLTTAFGKAFFFKHIRDFYSLIPPSLWARIDHHPVVWPYAAGFAKNYDQSLVQYVDEHFCSSFGGLTPYIVREISWNLATQNVYAWGAALNGAQIQGVAAVGPGYNDSAVPGRTTPVRDRENGEFYRLNWAKVLASARHFVVIETWNEFHEGTDICNSREYGRTFIDITADFVAKLKQPVKFFSFQPQSWVRSQHPTCLVMVQDKNTGIEPTTASCAYSDDKGLSWHEWPVTCTGQTGTKQSQMITARDIPFSQNAKPLSTPNYVRFSITNTNGDTATSVSFPVYNGTPPAFVASIDPGESFNGNGLRQRFNRNDDGWTGSKIVGGKSCVYNLVQNSSPYPGRYLYFDVEDSLVYAGSSMELWMTIEYYDTSATQKFDLQYDSPGATIGNRYKSGGSVQVNNSRQWKTHTFHLTNTFFANRENGSSDFRIYTPGVLFVHRVTVLNTEPTGVRDGKKQSCENVPGGFRLLQNYPNPFNPTTKISFEIPQEGRVTLSIYNLQGQIVTTLVHGKLSAGVHQVSFHANGLTSGIYFARLDADGNNSDTIKMSLLK